VPQVITVNKGFLSKRSGKLPSRVTKELDYGLRLVLSLYPYSGPTTIRI